MLTRNTLSGALDARVNADIVAPWRQPCRPRVLMLADGLLNWQPGVDFGLWRFLHAITVAPGVTNKPLLTLAHRGAHAPMVTVGVDNYAVLGGFNFSTAATPVTLANYDQVWLFGFDSGAFSLSNAEVGVLAEFMNGGGGVFATGDHGSLGRQLAGSLPRIRHMREWRDPASGGVPMGIENDVNQAVNRIDTVVAPGGNGLYDFEDQSDAIPQRIYPNYRVTDTDGGGGTAWQASVHPLLALPGAPSLRNSGANANVQFNKDIDVLPDHAHESVCYEVALAVTLGGNYALAGQNFPEFQPALADPTQRVGAQIVAYAVSGGRAVYLAGYSKPPVKPRMFGIVSAYDGRLAQPYPNKAQRPGRIVCDSTWHHYVNVNLDGGTSGLTGLGTGSGAGFAPSPDLLKIYAYYRNILTWLQPANRVWCSVFWDLAALRVHPALAEELAGRERLTAWPDWVALGGDARRVLDAAYGAELVRDQLTGLLVCESATAPLGDMLASGALASTAMDADVLLDGVLGGLLAHMVQAMPAALDAESAKAVLSQGPGKHLKALQARLAEAAEQGVVQQMARIERSLKVARRIQLKAQ